MMFSILETYSMLPRWVHWALATIGVIGCFVISPPNGFIALLVVAGLLLRDLLRSRKKGD